MLHKINKKAQTNGLITGLIMGVAGLVISVLIAFVIVSTLRNSNLLTPGSAEDNSTNSMVANFTTGVNNVSSKIPTVLLVSAIVLILGILAMLVAIWRKSQIGSGGVSI